MAAYIPLRRVCIWSVRWLNGLHKRDPGTLRAWTRQIMNDPRPHVYLIFFCATRGIQPAAQDARTAARAAPRRGFGVATDPVLRQAAAAGNDDLPYIMSSSHPMSNQTRPGGDLQPFPAYGTAAEIPDSDCLSLLSLFFSPTSWASRCPRSRLDISCTQWSISASRLRAVSVRRTLSCVG